MKQKQKKNTFIHWQRHITESLNRLWAPFWYIDTPAINWARRYAITHRIQLDTLTEHLHLLKQNKNTSLKIGLYGTEQHNPIHLGASERTSARPLFDSIIIIPVD